jgi:membrane dipeptidase
MTSTPEISDLLRAHPVVDGHNDLLWAMRDLNGYDFEAYDVGERQTRTHTDLPRLREGGVGAQFWSVFVPCAEGERSVTSTLEQVDAAYRMIERYADRLAPATTADEVEAAWADGRIACLMGAEGGHQIAESLGVLRMYHRLGVRYLTLTHNDNVPWADSATDEPVLHGLSDVGRDVVREMNRVGMFVDLSHVSGDVMRDALEVSTAPVLFSHSSARAICDHPRNVPDDVLASLTANGGVCMVTFVPRFVSQAGADRHAPAPPLPGVADVADHLDHVRDAAGIEHVGIGGDYDGSALCPAGLEDVSGYPRLFDELRSRGYSEPDLRRIGAGNVLRAMHDMERVASP